MTLNYTLVFIEEKIGFSVSVLELPWCISEWDTKSEAIKNIKEAIWLYIQWMWDIAKIKSKKEEKVSLSSLIYEYETV